MDVKKHSKKKLCISVPLELVELWKLKALIEKKKLEDVIIEAIDMYMNKYLRDAGFEPEEFEVEKEYIDVNEIKNWDILKDSGVDIGKLKRT